MPDFRLWRRTIQALQQAVEFVREEWIKTADAAVLTPRQKAEYVQGLQQPASTGIDVSGMELQGRVTQTSPLGTRIEEGTPGHHLPSVINWARAYARGTARRN